MATVTGLTKERMLEIEAESIVDAALSGDNLILTRHDGTPIDVGSVRGPQGIQGPPYVNGVDTVSDQTIDGVKTFVKTPILPSLDIKTVTVGAGRVIKQRLQDAAGALKGELGVYEDLKTYLSSKVAGGSVVLEVNGTDMLTAAITGVRIGSTARTDHKLAIRHDGVGGAFIVQNGVDANNSNVVIFGGDAGLMGVGTSGIAIRVNGSTNGIGSGPDHLRLQFKSDRTNIMANNGTKVGEFSNYGSFSLPLIAAAACPVPDAGFVALFIDAATNLPRLKLADGTLRSITTTNP